jgi:hypothetical protein
MPTALELAKQREARKLALAGFNPDGTPMDDGGGAGGANDDDDDDDRGGNDDPDNDDGRGAGDTGDEPSLREQIKALQRQLEAANGRAAPSQQQAAEYQTLWQKSETARLAREQELNQQIDALRAQLESANNTFDPAEVLTPEEIEAIEPSLLSTVVKLADSIAKRRAPKLDVRSEALRVVEEREAKKVENYRAQVLNDPARGLHQLGALTHDPEFIAWVKEDENDIDSVVNSLLNAKSTEEVDRYAKIVSKRIVKFKERNKRPADPKTGLGGHMRREPKPKLTEAETQAKLNEAKALSRSRNPADRQRAQQMLNSLQ